MGCDKFLRRSGSIEWANGRLDRALERGHYRRALRAANLITLSESWLNDNIPFDVTTYKRD